MDSSTPNSPIQILPDGRRYIIANGKQIFISPAAYGEAPPKDTTGIFRHGPQWNQTKGQYETPIDWGNLMNLGVGTFLTAGLSNAALAGGAAGEAATTLGETGGLIPGLSVPAASVPAAVATIPNVVKAVTSAIPPVAGIVGNTGSDKKALSPEAMALIDQQRARMEQANPLYENVLQLAFNRMPTASKDGLSAPSYDQANASVPAVSGGDYAEDPATRGLLRQQLIRSKMSDPMLQAVLRLAQSRMPNKGA